MRVISSNIVRIHCARSGASMPIRRLDRAHVGVLVAHHRHVVEAVHVADRLVERLGLGQLLGAAMQQADVRIGTLHDFAVHLQDQAQHAVRGRMLRAEVQRVVADFGAVEARGVAMDSCWTEWRSLLHLRALRGFARGGLVARIVADHARHQHARLDRVTGS